MLEFALIVVAATIVVVAAAIYDVAKAINRLAERQSGVPEQRRRFEQITPDVPYISKESSFSVPELPPEAIAPKIKRPPRPQGGFGSNVS